MDLSPFATASELGIWVKLTYTIRMKTETIQLYSFLVSLRSDWFLDDDDEDALACWKNLARSVVSPMLECPTALANEFVIDPHQGRVRNNSGRGDGRWPSGHAQVTSRQSMSGHSAHDFAPKGSATVASPVCLFGRPTVLLVK